MDKSWVLYDYWRSSASYRVRIALHYKGVGFHSIPIDLVTGGQMDMAFRQLNPNARVPMIKVGGRYLGQSLAIIELLESENPEPRLLPTDSWDRALVKEMVDLITMDIHPVCNLSVMNKAAEISQDSKQKKHWNQHFITRGFQALESLLERQNSQQYCFKQEFSLADVCLLPQVYNARRWEVEMEAFPRISAIEEYCLELDFVKAAYPLSPKG